MLPVQQQLEVTAVTFTFQDNKIQLQQAVKQQEAKSEGTYGREDLCLKATQIQNSHFFKKTFTGMVLKKLLKLSFCLSLCTSLPSLSYRCMYTCQQGTGMARCLPSNYHYRRVCKRNCFLEPINSEHLP